MAAARGPMLAVTERGVKKITVMGPTQLLKTELINNIVGYFIHQDPRPMIVMQPTGKMAETWSKDRLDKMIRDTPVLKSLVKDKKHRDSDNTILHKSFPGGHVTVVSSGSASDLAMRPVSVTLCDEVDKYERTIEGDGIKLIEERTATFWNALNVRVCSPTIKDASRIEAEYKLSDMREFHGKCRYCGKMELLSFKQLKWINKDPSTAYYECSHCNSHWSELDRLYAIHIDNCDYIATAPFNGHAGFHCNVLASPWESMKDVVTKWLEAIESDDPEVLKTFINTKLAETFEETGEKPDFQRLYERRETYKQNSLPKGVVFLVGGCDVQKDRWEIEVVGYCRDKSSFSIDYRVVMGDTSNPDEWKKLDPILDEVWKDANGRELTLRMFAIDSGYNTQQVYNWVRRKSVDRVRAVKGTDSLQTLVGLPSDVDVDRNGNKVKRALKLWPVGVNVAKSELYSWLQLDVPEDGNPYPPGFCHFPQYELEHFKRLTAEQLQKKKINGRIVYRWVQIYERNEQLDIRNYARAAASMFGMDRFTDDEWDILEGKYDLPVNKSEGTERRSDEPTQDEPEGDFWARQNNKKKLF